MTTPSLVTFQPSDNYTDALAAAFTWAMAEKDDFADAVRWGVAEGTASARLPGVRFANLEQAREIYAKVEVRSAK